MTNSAIVFNTMVWNKGVLMARYRFDTVLRLGTFYIFFLLAFMGAQTMGGASPNFGQTVGGLVVGFMVWTLTTIAFSEFSATLGAEAGQGTLEQLAMSPTGLGRVLMSRAAASLGFQLVIGTVFLFVMMATTGTWLHLDVLSILPILLLTVAGVLGVGFMMGGLTLLYKQTGALLGLMQFGFLALLTMPVKEYPLLKLAPLSWGNHLLSRVMVEGVSLASLPTTDVMILVAGTVGYMLLGGIVFKVCVDKARERGLLGQY
jgi:ABC-2 type transport system permease protein